MLKGSVEALLSEAGYCSNMLPTNVCSGNYEFTSAPNVICLYSKNQL